MTTNEQIGIVIYAFVIYCLACICNIYNANPLLFIARFLFRVTLNTFRHIAAGSATVAVTLMRIRESVPGEYKDNLQMVDHAIEGREQEQEQETI